MSQLTSENSRSRLPVAALLFMLAAAVVIGMALLSRFHGFKIYDDAYIFVRYADHLLAGHGMVWNVGEGPVYGATSLGYVFALIPFRLIFPDNPAAALFVCSFFWGLVFVGVIFRLGLKAMQPSPAFKPYLAGFLFLSLMAAAVTLRAHFASGMETTFVLAYLSFCLILWERLNQGHANAWWVGIIGGLAWWIRPDVLIFTWGVPLLVAILGKRVEWWRVLLVTMAVTGLALLGAKMLTGTWLPTSFFAKSTRLYGPEFAATYRMIPFSEGSRFVARTWPALFLIGIGVYLKWTRLREGYSVLDKALMLAMLVFGVYFTFFVLQVMGFGQRFYYPLFPFLLYLGMREIMDLPKSLRLGPGFQFKRIPTQMERIGMVVLGGMLLYYGIDYGYQLKQSKLEERLAVFSASTAYRADHRDYWVHLDQLAGLPSDLTIATTEVGMPAALYPERKIYDLAAANSPRLLADGLTARSVLAHCPADLIYMPHKNYQQLNADLAASREFAERYMIFKTKDLMVNGQEAKMGVAIRKDGPYAGELMRIFGE